MDASRNSRSAELILESRLQRARIDATLIQLKAIEAEVRELIAQITWQRYLGHDATSVEFIRNLGPPDVGSARPH